MAQYARPSSDIVVGGWSPEPLYQSIDEASANDGDYIESAEAPSNDSCEVALSSIPDPESAAGHIVRYRYCKNAAVGQGLDLTTRLMQGSTEIASWTHQGIGPSIMQAAQTLTTIEANSISDYGNLRLRFIANAP